MKPTANSTISGLKIPDYIRTLVPYVPGKPIEETQREFNIRRVIKLASNENPLGPCPKAIRAVKNALPEAHRYPDAGAYRLRQALCSHLKVLPESLIIGNGSNEVIDLLIRTYCQTGDAIVTSKAAFIAYKICAQIHGVRTLEASLTQDLRFNLPAIAKLVKEDERARMVFIANPNNPTGTYVAGAELRAFLKQISAIRGRSILVVLDYAYWEYVTARDLPDALELMREFSNVVVLRTFSKVYGLAGLRIGYGVAQPEVISAVEKVRQPFNMNSIGLIAAEAALSDRGFVTEARRVNQSGMVAWERALDQLGMTYWKSQGNFILADVGGTTGRPASEFYTECLKRGVILRPVANYGLPNALRISIGTPEENRVAIRVFREVCRKVSRLNEANKG